ncbi:unnamed protein product [Hymenolepis diminuta]|uniref:TPX2 domain-containing protein n=1 Tax=Hymenolepis diminuta TaxID=6216 RepID=A0A0R3SLI8_HYMDI|nr:unnamed protein product [Hymenolepis diminuta]VUZ57395.1 unnamed protein product [Hymenolepis diminuta]
MGDKDSGGDLGITPAAKVGSMRVAQRHREPVEKPLSREELMEQSRQYNSEIVVPPKHDFETPEELQFHDETVRRIQQKPLPQATKPTTYVQPRICQPRSN